MATARITGQMAQVAELRGRVGIVLSGAAVATGFLAGQALDASEGLPLSAWVGTISALFLVVACAYILLPRTWQGVDQNAQKVLDDIDREPSRKMEDYQRYLISFLINAAVQSDADLQWLYRVFVAALVLLMTDFAGWIWTLASH
jgi:hypothetical protein